MQSTDFTQLPVGRLPEGGCIAKCPKCGRNGLLTDCGNVQFFDHFGWKEFLTGSGELRARRIRRDALSMCRVEKLEASARRGPRARKKGKRR